VIRGGDWNNNAQNCRSANRNNDDADNRNNDLGFRLVSTKFRPISVVQGLRFCALGLSRLLPSASGKPLDE